MKRSLLLALVLLALPCHAAEIKVVYGKTVRVEVPGVTAAYSLDSIYADASVVDGAVVVAGRSPGETNVVAVTAAGVETLKVIILQPPPSYPPGFVPPAGSTFAAESGAYEFRYSSDPGQFYNLVSFTRRQAARRIQLLVVNANTLTADSGSRVSFPTLSYSIQTARRELVFGDKGVENSPLTVSGAAVRGFHFAQGRWQGHFGLVSQLSFRDLLLSTDSQQVFGLSRRFDLGERKSLMANLYRFGGSGQINNRKGNVVSALYQARPNDRLEYAMELGWSHGPGVGATMRFDNVRTQMRGEFRHQPSRFAGITVNDLHGTNLNLDWSRSFSERFGATAFMTLNRYALAGGPQSSLNSSLLAQYRLATRWSVQAGLGQSSFGSNNSARKVSSITLPVGANFHTPRVGIGFNFQHSQTTGLNGGSGNQVRVNARSGWRKFQFGGFIEKQSRTPTLQVTAAPGSPLADTLARQTALATTPGQIAAARDQSTALAALGYVQGTEVRLAMQRTQMGATVTWARQNPRRDLLTYTMLRSTDTFAQASGKFSTDTVTYSRRLSDRDDIGASYSRITHTSGRRWAFEVAIRHRFSAVPSYLIPGTRGTISGYVFVDPDGSGRLQADSPRLAEVEVVLDGTRRTRTNSDGHYSFTHVPFGTHQVAVSPKINEPHYFTTASTAQVEINSSADFGVAYASAQVFGFVLNDVNHAVAGVGIVLTGGGRTYTARTADDGKFAIAPVATGAYSIAIDQNSVPPGYALGGLQQKQVTVSAGNPQPVAFTLAANRSISGKVVAYDRALAREVAIQDIEVVLSPAGRTTRTDQNGVYLFRGVAPGEYAAVVRYGEKEYSQVVEVPSAPATVRGVNLNVGVKR